MIESPFLNSSEHTHEYNSSTSTLRSFGMIAAIIIYSLVMKYPDGEEKVKKIGDQIHKGALAFMKTEYKYLIIFILVLVVLAGIFLGKETAIAVIVGAACSSLAGFIGMYAATKANVRTATAAQKDECICSAFSIFLRWLNNGPLRCITRSYWTWGLICILCS